MNGGDIGLVLALIGKKVNQGSVGITNIQQTETHNGLIFNMSDGSTLIVNMAGLVSATEKALIQHDNRNVLDKLTIDTTTGRLKLDNKEIGYITDIKFDGYLKSEIDTLLNNKIDKVSGKGLSTEDFTTAEKTKLQGLSNSYNDLVDKPTIPTVDVNKEYVNNELNKKANLTHTHSQSDITGLETTLNEINQKIDSLSGTMQLKGHIDDLTALNKLTDMDTGDVYVVNSEKATYVYTECGWKKLCDTEVKLRDFVTNPINLETEVTGKLPTSRLGDDIAFKVDLHNHTNKDVLDKLNVDAKGKLTYNNIEVHEETDLSEYAKTSDVNNSLTDKVDKVVGKDLSTNDLTNILLDKINNIEENANKYELPKASATTLGGIKIGSGLSIDDKGVVAAMGGNVDLTNYYDKQEVDEMHSLKADTSQLNLKADKTYVDAELKKKLNISNIKDISLTTATLNIPTEITMTSGELTYTVVNGICYVAFRMNITATEGLSWVNLCTLPKANVQIYCTTNPIQGGEETITLSVNTNGYLKIYLQNAISTSKIFSNTFSYPVAE